MSIASLSLKLSGLFEAELLVELMLRYWNHPFAEDREFRNILLERGAEALRSATHGQALIEGLPADRMNLVAAIWYAEWASLDAEHAAGDESVALANKRNEWLDVVRHAVPSCFCSPDLLP